MSTSAAKVFIQVESEAEQEANLKQTRKHLKPIQGTNDKENLTGRVIPALDQISRLKTAVAAVSCNALATPEYGKRKRFADQPTLKIDAETQTEVDAANEPITVEDLTNICEPGENYYKRLAEKRREALEHTLGENQHLNERIEGLETELSIMREELQETKHLVEVMKEIIGENDEEEIEDDKVELTPRSDDEDDVGTTSKTV